jgi:DNA-binding response OmpR family regulator
LELLKSDETIDLVVSDVGLPELNGREMIDSVREHRPGLKVLFITGYAENANFGLSDVGQDMQLITKPFPLEILAQRIREMIKKHKKEI